MLIVYSFRTFRSANLALDDDNANIEPPPRTSNDRSLVPSSLGAVSRPRGSPVNFRSAGLPTSRVRPTFYVENLRASIPETAGLSTNYSTLGATSISPVFATEMTHEEVLEASLSDDEEVFQLSLDEPFYQNRRSTYRTTTL